MRKARQGIDATKLNIGDIKAQKKKKPKEGEEAQTYGLQRPGEGKMELDEEFVPLLFIFSSPKYSTNPSPLQPSDDDETKSRKLVRSNNFTQQTNALDVDKHMFVLAPFMVPTFYIQYKTSRQDGLH